MSGCLKELTMHKIARIILDVAAIGWLALIAIALIMSLSSCGTTSGSVMSHGVSPKYQLQYDIECCNCDEID